jgi:hypothetical protein
MKSATLTDIQQKLRERRYHTDEQIRISLVLRVLQELGWDIWSPSVFKPDFVWKGSKSCVVLFEREHKQPCVLISVLMGTILESKSDMESMLNRRLREPIPRTVVLTNGTRWYFFRKPLNNLGAAVVFEQQYVIDILRASADDIISGFRQYLGEEQVRKHVEETNNDRRHREEKQRLISSKLLPVARGKLDKYPFPNIIESLLEQARIIDLPLTEIEAKYFLTNDQLPPTKYVTSKKNVQLGGHVVAGQAPVRRTEKNTPTKQPSIKVIPKGPLPNLTYSKIKRASFCGSTQMTYANLLRDGICFAIRKRGKTIQEIRSNLQVNITDIPPSSEGDKGYREVHGTKIWLQTQRANSTAKNLVRLAKWLGENLEIRVRLDPDHGDENNRDRIISVTFEFE